MKCKLKRRIGTAMTAAGTVRCQVYELKQELSIIIEVQTCWCEKE